MSYIGSTPANKLVTSSDMEDGIVTTPKIADDAATADKIANAVNSAITANTSKTTNATHSGEVTGSGALTIADNIVDEANLKVSNSPTNGYMLTAQSGNTGGLTWVAAPASSVTGDVYWRAYPGSAQSFSDSSETKINFGSEVYDVGGGWNTSNSTFTVPSGKDGLYLIGVRMQFANNTSNGHKQQVNIYVGSSSIMNFQSIGGSTGSISVGGETIVVLNAGDAVTFKAWQNYGTGSITANDSSVSPTCWGMRINND